MMEIEVDAEGLHRVSLGEGVRPLPRDPGVAHLALCMYDRLCPVSPSEIWAHVERQAELPLERPSAAEGVPGGDTTDPLLRTCTLADVSQQVIARYWATTTRATTLGHRRTVHRFGTHEGAKRALALESLLRAGTAEDVLRCLSRSLEPVGRLRRGLVATDLLEWPVAATECTPEAGEPAVMSLGAWVELVGRVRRAGRVLDGDGRGAADVRCSSRLTAVVPARRMAHRVTVAHHQWRLASTSSLEPRAVRWTGRVTLRFVPHAVYGGHVLLEWSEGDDSAADDEWPSWIDECRQVDPRVLPHVLPRDPVTLRLPLWKRARGGVDPSDTSLDKAVRTVLQHWGKSQAQDGVDAPYLLRVRALDDAHDAEYRTEDGALAARRWTGRADVERELMPALCDGFGKAYALSTVTRVADDAHCGAYAVIDADGAVVAAVVVVLYDCILVDGTRSAALMVDSVAVSKRFAGTGVGGRVFRELLRPLAARHACGRPYVIFAQCVRKGDAQRYWWDKLDESGVARSLMLQAWIMEPSRVCVQSETQCSPRSRQYDA